MQLKKKIFVAEDDALIRNFLRTLLQNAGFDVRTGRNGREALETLYPGWADAMVLDINMPELDGFGVLETLKSAAIKAPPTLVLTARHSSEDVRRAMTLGAKDYLTKPFSENQLLARVSRILRPPPPPPASAARRTVYL